MSFHDHPTNHYACNGCGSIATFLPPEWQVFDTEGDTLHACPRCESESLYWRNARRRDFEVLVCQYCHQAWLREVRVGRKPHRCPACRRERAA